MADNKLAIVGVSLIILPMIIFIIVFAYCFISVFMEEVKIHGWKKALENNSNIFAMISICIGLILTALANME